MPQCTIKNTGDLPLCITDPDKGEVYCILPGYTCAAKSEWPDVRRALRTKGRAQLIAPGSVKKGKA